MQQHTEEGEVDHSDVGMTGEILAKHDEFPNDVAVYKLNQRPTSVP